MSIHLQYESAMSRTRKPAEIRRAEITSAVLELLNTQSPGGLSTAAIAAHVGVSHSALFRHFATKDALWAGVMDEIEARARASWDAAEAQGGPPAAQLRALLRAQAGLIARTPAIPNLIFSPGHLAAETVTRPIHTRIMAEFHTRISSLIARAMRDGALCDDVAPGDATLLLMGLLQGLVLRWTLSKRGFDLEAEAARLIELQLRLMRAPDRGEMP
ncbi:TetR/AcrR family transcriptional regulator [Sediminimonas qiaohouensis]|uniref:TetR/AcrR family transcriptional regulator n=1 Tax=Sediminimonas qiaohouensis TaxID=552061 RepID=UPI00235583A2|nr:TetR/AcrR family transcriptional regulator [Sediminimonas qiaohouensis]